MAQFFPFSGNQRYRAFVDGQLHTEDGGYKIRTMTGVNATGLASATLTITASAAGNAIVTITPSNNSILSTEVLTVTLIAGDTIATAALKVANAIRTSPIGYYFNVTTAAGVVTMTARNRGVEYNLASISATVLTATGATVLAVASTSVYRPGRFVGYDTTSVLTQSQYSVPQFAPIASLANIAGLIIHSPELWVADDNTLSYPAGIETPIASEGVASLEIVNGVVAPLAIGGNVFLSLGGANQGRLAASAIDANYQQVNLPGQRMQIHPVAGLVQQGGAATQKVRFTIFS